MGSKERLVRLAAAALTTFSLTALNVSCGGNHYNGESKPTYAAEDLLKRQLREYLSSRRLLFVDGTTPQNESFEDVLFKLGMTYGVVRLDKLMTGRVKVIEGVNIRDLPIYDSRAITKIYGTHPKIDDNEINWSYEVIVASIDGRRRQVWAARGLSNVWDFSAMEITENGKTIRLIEEIPSKTKSLNVNVDKPNRYARRHPDKLAPRFT